MTDQIESMKALKWTGTVWGIKWVQRNREGDASHLMHTAPGPPVAFRTRAEARAWVTEYYGYIADRADLRAEPHGWRVPRVVRVMVTVEEGL